MDVNSAVTIATSALVGFSVGYFLLRNTSSQRDGEQNEKKSPNGKIKNVLVIIAMEAEALPLINKLNLKNTRQIDPHFPCEMYTGQVQGCNITVVTNGKDGRFGVDNVGTTPAALSTFLAIRKIRPDLLINAGTAGGFGAKGGNIGDVYISLYCRHHDRRIPIPGFLEYGRGDHQSIPVPNLVKFLRCKTGVVTTSNSLDHTEKDDQKMAENEASVKDMEAAAVAWVADITGTPMFAIKVVTDIVDGDRPTEEEFLENLHMAGNSLQEAVPKALEFVLGKSLSAL